MAFKFVPFGDSHSIFWANNSIFGDLSSTDPIIDKVIWMGPAKIWGLNNNSANRTKERFSSILDCFASTQEDIPVACFGEIDIRVNLSRFVLLERKFEFLDELAEIYLTQLSRIPKDLIIIWGPGPSMTEVSQKQLNTEWPSFGTEVTRNVLIHKFNKAILLKINRFPKLKFATLFYHLVGTDMLAKSGALLDGLHLSNSNYPLAREMILGLTRENVKVVFDFQNFKLIDMINFGFYENTKPRPLFLYQLYKFYEPGKFEVFLQAFQNTRNIRLSTIEIDCNSNSFPERFDCKDEIAFINEYFSAPTLECVREFTSYAFDRLSTNNADLFDVVTKSEKFNKEFLISHFVHLRNSLGNHPETNELNFLMNKLVNV